MKMKRGMVENPRNENSNLFGISLSRINIHVYAIKILVVNQEEVNKIR